MYSTQKLYQKFALPPILFFFMCPLYEALFCPFYFGLYTCPACSLIIYYHKWGKFSLSHWALTQQRKEVRWQIFFSTPRFEPRSHRCQASIKPMGLHKCSFVWPRTYEFRETLIILIVVYQLCDWVFLKL